MDSLLSELQHPLRAKLLQTVSDAYKTSGDDLELFGLTSLKVFGSLPGYDELLRQQLCAGGVAVRPHPYSMCTASAPLQVLPPYH